MAGGRTLGADQALVGVETNSADGQTRSLGDSADAHHLAATIAWSIRGHEKSLDLNIT